MRALTRLPFWRRPWAGPLLAFCLLLLALVLLTSEVVREARRTAESHQQAVDDILNQYAQLAAWEIGRHARQDLQMILDMTFQTLEREGAGTSPEPLPPYEILARLGECGCPRIESVSLYFRLDMDDSAFDVRGADVPAVRRWIVDTLRAHVREVYLPQWRIPEDGPRARWMNAVVFHPEEPAARALSYRLALAGGVPRFVYGYVFDPADLEAAFEWILSRRAILPSAVTRGLPLDSLLEVSVTASSRLLFGSPERSSSEYLGIDRLEPMFGGMSVQATILPRSATTLVLGGAPRVKATLLSVLFAVTIALAILAVHLFRAVTLARLRTGFISGVSHELRTPMAQIRMFTEMLRLGRVRAEEERQEWLGIIDREAKRLTQLTENVLQFSRAERRRLSAAPELVNIAEEAREVIAGFTPLLRSAETSIRTEFDEGADAFIDRGALRQILINLLDNAGKYGPPAQTITVGAAVGKTGAVGLWVDDQGPGIPRRDRKRVLRPFRRLDSASAKAIGGSGIGLTVVKELVELHDGRVRVEDAPGGGARIRVELPPPALQRGVPKGASE